MKYKNLTIIGTSHISIESVRNVEKTIKEQKPHIVAVELDKDRFLALFSKQKRNYKLKDIGLKGFLFAIIGSYIEKKLGKIVNVEPGSDMKTAIMLAKEQNAKVAFIDQHILITLRRFSQTFSWKEKLNFLVDIFRGIFAKKKELEKIGLKSLDLTKVPKKEVIRKLIAFVKKRYPNAYKVLIEERNEYMANNLVKLIERFPKDKIVAIVGAGHEEAILKLVKQKLYKLK